MTHRLPAAGLRVHADGAGLRGGVSRRSHSNDALHLTRALRNARFARNLLDALASERGR